MSDLRPESAAQSHPHGPGAFAHALLFGLKKVPRRNWVIGGLALALAAAGTGALFFWLELDWGELMDRISHLPTGPLLAAMALLPIVGFPILPVYLVAGARYGALGGGAAVALATAAHLLGTYLIARTVLRGWLERLLERWHKHLPAIPRDEQAAVAVIAALVPGLPYVVRNYLLAMTGIRLSVYFWICLPIYVARSYVSILLGELGAEPDGKRLIILGVVETVKVVICGAALWWLRQHHRRRYGGRSRGASTPPIPQARD